MKVHSDLHIFKERRYVGPRPGLVPRWPLCHGRVTVLSLPTVSPSTPTEKASRLHGPAVNQGQKTASFVSLHLGSWHPERRQPGLCPVGGCVFKKKKKKDIALRFVSLVGNVREGSAGHQPLLCVFWFHRVIPECSRTQPHVQVTVAEGWIK